MFIKLESSVIKILACPLCKGAIERAGEKFICKDCGTGYFKQRILQKGHIEYVLDFRIHRPFYCIPNEVTKWADRQEEYKKDHHQQRKLTDNLDVYLNEIDSVREIYDKEFNIKGKVLDVGGGAGTLRHFLKDNNVSLYVSIDPYLEIFQNLESQPNLLRAYSCLRKPCNFILAHAENLPFKKNSFDWVHMRSVLDHLQDPYLALKEAFQVLKKDGVLLIGTSTHEKQLSLSKRTNNNSNKNKVLNGSIVKFIKEKITKETEKDNHMFYWQYKNLLDLLSITGFTIVKEHWQKPPYTNCIYLSAKKGL